MRLLFVLSSVTLLTSATPLLGNTLVPGAALPIPAVPSPLLTACPGLPAAQRVGGPLQQFIFGTVGNETIPNLVLQLVVGAIQGAGGSLSQNLTASSTLQGLSVTAPKSVIDLVAAYVKRFGVKIELAGAAPDGTAAPASGSSSLAAPKLVPRPKTPSPRTSSPLAPSANQSGGKFAIKPRPLFGLLGSLGIIPDHTNAKEASGNAASLRR